MNIGNPEFHLVWQRSPLILCTCRKTKAKYGNKCLAFNANNVEVGKFGGDKDVNLDFFERNID